MSVAWRVTLALIAGFWLLLWPWTQLTRDTGSLLAAALTATAVILTGTFAARLVAVLRLLMQVVVGAVGLLLSVIVGFGADVVSDLPQEALEGWAFIQSSSAPVGPHPGVALIIIGALAVLGLAAQAASVPTRWPALGIMPLVCLYVVPSLVLVTPMLVEEFLLLVVAIVGLLWAGSALPSGGLLARATALLTTVGIGAITLALTLAAAQAFPTLEPRRPQEPLQMNDPSLDLKRNLVEGSRDVILSYRTDNPGGEYLKLATLPMFSAEGFGLADVRVGSGRLPGVPGDPRGEQRTTEVSIGAFRSEWLPVPYAPTRVDAPGEWGFALDTLDVMALTRLNRASATEGLTYTVTSLAVRPDAATIAAATSDAAPRRDLNTGIGALPQDVIQLAQQVTAGRTTAGAKAQALEAYLRSDRFTYSTAPAVGVGDGLATIQDFLFRSRRGYCEQFAGSMTLMARSLGIPARLAVGFVPGTQADGEWRVTARDMHTWPEIWLDGQGWVAFEPTPARGDAGPINQAPEPTTSAPPTTDANVSPEPEPEETPSVEPQPADPAPAEGGPGGLLPWLALALVLAAGATAVGLLPRWRRRHRRATRLAGTGDARLDTLAAWDEVRDTASDLKLAWPDGSPRFAAERLAGQLDDPDAVAALRRLAAAAERALFDRSEGYDLPGIWRDEVLIIAASLTATAQARRTATPRHAA